MDKDCTKRNSVPKSVWQKPSHFIAFGFGSGAAPYAPGTVGTLITIPICWLLALCGFWVYSIVVLLAIPASIFLCDRVSREINIHDHQGMVLDEIIGYLVTMWGIPKGIGWLFLGFLLFRLFDIWKPGIIRYVDRNVHGGLGIILDDLLAGIYAWVILFALSLLLK